MTKFSRPPNRQLQYKELKKMDIEQIDKERLELMQKARIANKKAEEGLHICGFCDKEMKDCNNECDERKKRLTTTNINSKEEL